MVLGRGGGGALGFKLVQNQSCEWVRDGGARQEKKAAGVRHAGQDKGYKEPP